MISNDAELLEAMMLVRAFEEQNRALANDGKAHGTCTSIGQEAAAVGVVKGLEARDLILTNHRSAGHLLARGADPGRVLAEMMGRSTGYCKGKSGSLHISAKELGVILTSTIVGAELSMATGVALSLTMQKSDAIVTTLFGDGAACEGAFHESLNLAAVWNLPVLYVCENNQWQAYVHRRETMLTEKLASRVQVTGFEALKRMVLAGLGVGVAPDSHGPPRRDGDLVCIPLSDTRAHYPLNLCTRAPETLSMAVRLMVQHLLAPPAPRR